MYFSIRQIPALRGLKLTTQIALVHQATKRLTVPEKTLLNVLKLVIIVPIFAFILRTSQDWTSLIWAFVIFLLYPLLIKPIQYSLCAKYIPPQHKETL
jgi:hypothetical protein